jgi:serpin B
VDEGGTEASAVTIITMAVESIPEVELTIDRPFIFAIIDRETGTILFLGRVMDPSQ